jgi:hypothetical protein
VNACLSNGGRECFIAGAELPDLRNRAMKDCKKICASVAADGLCEIQDTIIHFTNKSFIKFISVSDEFDGQSVRCDIIYFNEIAEIKSFNHFNEFAKRARLCVFMDFNPRAGFFLQDIRNNYKGRIDELKLTWRDNECLPPMEVEAIKKIRELGEGAEIGSVERYNYEVYYLGNFSGLGGGVFTGVEQISEADYSSVSAAEFGGMDFGDVSDPNAVVGVKVVGDTIFAKEYLYKSEMSDREVADELADTNFEFIAFDTATGGITRARNLYSYNRSLRLRPCVKGAGSVSAGVYNLRQYRLRLCGDNLYREFSRYVVTDRGFGGDDHLIDAVRYVFSLLQLKRIV